MGAVYRAQQHAVGRDVAVKILRRERAVDAAAKARFLREARVHSQLSSPNTVRLLDFGQSSGGELFLTMELLEGESLGQRLARVKRFTPTAAVEVARQVLRALSEAHQKGIIHRDLKPDNIFHARMASGGEMTKVLDFGIAKMLGESHGLVGNGKVFETQQGTVFGTPRYMSPEQAQGKPLDGRSDLYSVGVLLYQMLSGDAPFTDSEPVVVMSRHIRTAPKSLLDVAREMRIPPALAAAVHRALSKSPGGRPESAEAMSQELAAALAKPKTTRVWYDPRDGKTVEIAAVRNTRSTRYVALIAAAFLGVIALGASSKRAHSEPEDPPSEAIAANAGQSAAPIERGAPPNVVAPENVAVVEPATAQLADPVQPAAPAQPAAVQPAAFEQAVAAEQAAPRQPVPAEGAPAVQPVPTVDVNNLPHADNRQQQQPQPQQARHARRAPLQAAPPKAPAAPRANDKYGSME